MKRETKIVAVIIAAVCLVPTCMLLSAATGSPFGGGLCLLALGAALLAPGVRDTSYSTSDALPNGATHVHTTAIDLGITSKSQFCGGRHVELLIEAPALTFAMLGNAATMTYEVFHDTDSAFGTEVSLYGGPNLTQTGAGGVGAAAATKRIALPTDVKRYLRVTATNSAAGDASTKKVVTNLVF